MRISMNSVATRYIWKPYITWPWEFLRILYLPEIFGNLILHAHENFHEFWPTRSSWKPYIIWSWEFLRILYLPEIFGNLILHGQENFLEFCIYKKYSQTLYNIVMRISMNSVATRNIWKPYITWSWEFLRILYLPEIFGNLILHGHENFLEFCIYQKYLETLCYMVMRIS